MTQELTNWTDLDKDFTRKPLDKTYQQLWQEQGFSYQQTKQYLNQGFKIADFFLLIFENNYLPSEEWLLVLREKLII